MDQPGLLQASRSDEDEALAGLSARNRLRGFIDEVRIDGLLAQVDYVSAISALPHSLPLML